MADEQTLAILVAGREQIRDRDDWWGLGRPADGLRMCALQALFFSAPSRSRYLDAGDELCLSSEAMFGRPIHVVNDYRGHDAVLRCYNDAIARVQARLVTAVGEGVREADLVVSGD